jgi:hypothetical protein
LVSYVIELEQFDPVGGIARATAEVDNDWVALLILALVGGQLRATT